MEINNKAFDLHNLLTALGADDPAYHYSREFIDDETIVSYVDGRCSSTDRRRVEAAMLRHDDVRQLVEWLRRDPYFLGGHSHPATNGYADPGMEPVAPEPNRCAGGSDRVGSEPRWGRWSVFSVA